jgi:hypothetical protein
VPHVFLHAQGSIEGAMRMIFMSNRRAEERKDAIPKRLGHVAFVAVDGLHHELQSRIDDVAGLFWIEMFDQGS